MNDTINSIEAFREARARKARMRELEREQAARAAEAELPRHEAKAIAHERARWKKKDYKPGRLAPGSTTQYTKTYKREESEGVRRRRRQSRVEREDYIKRWQVADAEARQKQREARARWESDRRKKRAAAMAKPALDEEHAVLLVDGSIERMSLAEAAAELRVPLSRAARVLALYGAERQEDGCYLRGQVLRAALVWRNEHPLITGAHEGFYTYDEAAAFVGVCRDTIKHRARWDKWQKFYMYNTSVNQVCVYFRAADIARYKEQYDEWLNAGDSDHTHCLKLRQRRRNSPRKPKRR